MNPRFCPHCKAPLPPAALWCPRCGQPLTGRAAKRKGHPFLATLVVLGLAAMLVVFLRKHLPFGERLDPHVAKELVSGQNQVALEIPGTLQVRYRDLGERVELAVSAQANPVIVVDENANHVVDGGDLSLQALPGDKVCAGSPLANDVDPCGGTARGAHVRVSHDADWTTATWVLPKADLTHGQHYVDVVFQVFHGDTQKTESFPAEPFSKVYRLQFLDDGSDSYGVFPSSRLGEDEHRAALTPRPRKEKSIELPPSPSGSGEASLTATPEITEFEATPSAVIPGSPARLHWSTRGADRVTLEPGLGTVASQGSMSVAPTTEQRYTLTVHGAGGVTKRDLTVAVLSPGAPAITSFSADSTSLQPGESTHLHWTVTGAVKRVRLDPVADNVADHGMQAVSPAQTTEYTLVAEGTGGTVTSRISVHVAAPIPATPPAPAISFTATPANIDPGEAVTLRWHVTGADSVTIDPAFGSAGPEGTEVVRPLSSTEYTLTARGKGGVSGRQVAISVRRATGPSNGRLVWTGEVHGTQLVTIHRNQADVGQLEGSLPGVPCLIQPVNEKNVSIASTPGPSNDYSRLVLRLKGSGPMRVEVQWSLQ